jgi:hypothetical protein
MTSAVNREIVELAKALRVKDVLDIPLAVWLMARKSERDVCKRHRRRFDFNIERRRDRTE